MAQQWQTGWLDRIREWPTADKESQHGVAHVDEPTPSPGKFCGSFTPGRVDLSVVGSYRNVQTFAATFHRDGSSGAAPRRMIGTEDTLRDFLAQGNCPQTRLDAAVTELKNGRPVTVQSFQLSRESQHAYLLGGAATGEQVASLRLPQVPAIRSERSGEPTNTHAASDRMDDDGCPNR